MAERKTEFMDCLPFSVLMFIVPFRLMCIVLFSDRFFSHRCFVLVFDAVIEMASRKRNNKIWGDIGQDPCRTKMRRHREWRCSRARWKMWIHAKMPFRFEEIKIVAKRGRNRWSINWTKVVLRNCSTFKQEEKKNVSLEPSSVTCHMNS